MIDSQVLFLVLLYGLGLLIGLFLKDEIPILFICCTAFLWGTLFWVLLALVCLVFSIPYSFQTMIWMIGIAAAFLVVIHIRSKARRIMRIDIFTVAVSITVFGGLASVANHFNFSILSPDSIYMIMNGRVLSTLGFSDFIQNQLALRGVFLPLLQSISTFLGIGYLNALIPSFAFSFLAIFGFLCLRIIRSYTYLSRWVAFLLVCLTESFFASTYFIIFQVYYIHVNFISGIYLFVAVGSFWLALREHKQSWNIMAMMALTGFSLLRTEAPLFALVFLVLVISFGQISYKMRIKLILPYLVFITLWYVYLLSGMEAGSKILKPWNTILIILGLVGFGVLLTISKYRWIEQFVFPRFPYLIMVVLILVIVILTLQDPTIMKSGVIMIFKNWYITGLWGPTAVVLTVITGILIFQPIFPYEKLFSVGILTFLLLLLILYYQIYPAHDVGWGDSANRMITHIVPVVILYGLIKFSRGFTADQTDVSEFNNLPRYIALVAGASILFTVLLIYFT